jgi:hypothetical protein
MAISKADLFPPGTTAEQLCKEIVDGAADQLNGVAKAVGSKAFGHQFLLLSSVRGDGSHVADAHQYVGLELVAPLALVSVLSELAARADRGVGFGILGALLQRLSAAADLINRLDDFLPPRYQVLTALLNALTLKEGLDQGTEYFRKKQAAAAKRGRALEALGAAMRAELASSAAQNAFYRNQ